MGTGMGMGTATAVGTGAAADTIGATDSRNRAGGRNDREFRPPASAHRPRDGPRGQLMIDRALLFREEALLFREDQRGHDDPAGQDQRSQGQRSQGQRDPVSPRWTARAYWVLLALVAAGLLGGTQVRVGEFARGPAVVRGQTVEAVVPAAFASELRAGLPLELILRGRAPVTVTISSTGPELPGAGAASRLLGTDVNRAGLPPGTLMVVRATAAREITARDAAGLEAGTASVQVGSQRLIHTLVAGLAPASGTGDG